MQPRDIVSTVALAAAVAILCSAPAFAATVKVGDTPNLKLKTIGGKAFDSEDLEGRIVILEFWATWCGPCIKQLPHLREINKKYKDKGVVLISVSIDDSSRAAENFIKKNDMPWTQVHDGSLRQPIAGAFGVRSIPYAAVLSPDGKVLWKNHPGAGLDEAIESALKNHPPKPKDNDADEEGQSDSDSLLAARKAIAGDNPDWPAMLDTLLAITDEQLQSTAVKAQLAALFRQANAQAKQHPMDDALAANPEGAARFEALAQTFAPKVAVDSRIIEARLNRAQAAQKDGDHAEAYDLYQWVAERAGDTPAGEAAQDAVTAYEADPELMAIIKTQRDEKAAGALLNTAHSYTKADRKDLALETYKQLIAKYPDTDAAEKARAAARALD